MNQHKQIICSIQMTSSSQSIPWVEKYRPTEFSNIVLDTTNRNIFENIIQKEYFPNLLFYGPPGTGKTTTIINLINEYQRNHSKINKENIIHLNASDERGIDIIRNQIQQFVKSKNFFEVGIKFVILDEVDYMTKNAQQALKYLMQSTNYNVRYCLICNYRSKLIHSLQSEFICVRFNQLPQQEIYNFIKIISENEKLYLPDDVIYTIQGTYKSDIRSMINFLQLNQNLIEWSNSIITTEIWDKIYNLHKNNKHYELKQYIHEISIKYNIDKKSVIIKYLNHMIRTQINITLSFLEHSQVIVHSDKTDLNNTIDYFCENFTDSYT